MGMRMTQISTQGIGCTVACLLSLVGCGDSLAPTPRNGTPSALSASDAAITGVAAAQAAPAAKPAARTASAAMVTALPLSYTGTLLDHLSDPGRATGIRLANASGLALPVSVSPADVVMASERNFFGNDRRRWTLLRTTSANPLGVLGGHAVVSGRHIAWSWNGTPAIRYAVPAGYTIKTVVGPSDDGILVADTYNPATYEQEILSWQTNGGRTSLYRIVQVKSGLQLFGMASNGLIGAIERDGILLTPKLYDGQWHALPFDYINCHCEARRVNARGQVLMSPLPDLGGDPYGYLVTRARASLLPRADPNTTYADLNDLGDVVGNSGGRPIVILDGVLHDLNAYADSGAAGWQFLSAVAINGRRQVLGAGLWQGQTRWYRLNLR